MMGDGSGWSIAFTSNYYIGAYKQDEHRGGTCDETLALWSDDRVGQLINTFFFPFFSSAFFFLVLLVLPSIVDCSFLLPPCPTQTLIKKMWVLMRHQDHKVSETN